MRFMIASGAAALILAAALPAAAQTTATQPTAPSGPASSAGSSAYGSTTAPSASTSGADTSATASATLAVGLPVKDNTGATIGSITQVKPDAAGKKVATIKMGTDTFAVDSTSLAVQDGAAVINATQSELRDMMKKSPKPAG